MQLTDCHGVHIRNEEFPLQAGDELTLHSCQVQGTYDGYPHFATPGRYVIEQVGGSHDNELILFRTDTKKQRTRFRCTTHAVYAILGDWSEYKKATP